MFGNHRDGWTYGASDPSSGTAVMMEIVRVLGEHKKKGVEKISNHVIFVFVDFSSLVRRLFRENRFSVLFAWFLNMIISFYHDFR